MTDADMLFSATVTTYVIGCPFLKISFARARAGEAYGNEIILLRRSDDDIHNDDEFEDYLSSITGHFCTNGEKENTGWSNRDSSVRNKVNKEEKEVELIVRYRRKRVQSKSS